MLGRRLDLDAKEIALARGRHGSTFACVATMQKVSLSTLAAKCGMSASTVSRALSGHANVRADVRQRIEAEARRQGYSRNQLVGSLMSYVRAARTERFLGNLAMVHIASPEQPEPRPMQQIMIDAARRRATELGFHLDVLRFNHVNDSALALGRMLQARGVQGVVFLYSKPTDITRGFPWERFAAAEIDYGSNSLQIHTIVIDHYLTLTNALLELRSRGYARIGLFIERYKDTRLMNKWSAAFRSFQESQGGIGHLPLLLEEVMAPDVFLAWHRRHKPDLVIGHVDQAVVWLRQAGVRVPGKTAFFNLNWNERTRACAGLDLRAELQGTAAVESVVAQIQRNERGLPSDPHTVMLSGRWMEGPTLRSRGKGISAPAPR